MTSGLWDVTWQKCNRLTSRVTAVPAIEWRLWEVRSSLPGRREGRVLFGFHRGMLIALHDYIKKTQKTPLVELALARERLKEVQS